MKDFFYFTPTKVYFGEGKETDVGSVVRAEGASKVLVVYGGKSAIKSGLLERVYKSLKSAGVEYCSLGGVKPNPRLSLVYEGINSARENKVDMILAVGGGSVIDTSKAIAAGVVYEGDVWDLYIGKSICPGSLPVGCILTIAATGSEMSNGSVITNDKNQLKRSFDSDYSRCRFAIMNPELTYSLPEYQTASGCVDIIMHTLERYFSFEYMSLSDAFSAAIVKTIMKYAPIALQSPFNYEARANIMWAGSLSHNGLTGCGTEGDWAPHMIEHELGGMYDVAHGAGLSAIWGAWARYVLDDNPERFAMFAADMMDIDLSGKSAKEAALEGIDAIEAFFRSISMPVNLRELGVEPTDEEIKQLAWQCCDGDTHTVGHFRALTSKDVENILTMSL